LSGFRGIRACLNGTFYAELRVNGFRLALGTYDVSKLAARAYNCGDFGTHNVTSTS
jgi:hypothetical protein